MPTATETDTKSKTPSEYHHDTSVDSISQSLAKAVLQDDTARSARPDHLEKIDRPFLPIIVYTRSQLLLLHNSPLVRPPLNMPELKDWFGADLDQTTPKKETESSSSSARERRFRRDADDGDTRPSFRSAISQPSQMGNFKHQSLRANDRDKERDRDGDRDRERDLRDREGQERLRHLSDKYDRDRLTLSGTGTRGKEKDGTSNASSRLSSQSSTTPSRRTENRDGTKKRSGEVVEDWRRIGEPSRSGRDERFDNGRRDRDDRERPRSRLRDSSRSKRDASTTRRGRDERDRHEDSVRERSSRGDKDRDEYRRDRDRDRDKDADIDDPRHWRDDGKREERMAARRERERGSERDATWDSTNDRRWAADERDSRTKRSTRDKKSLHGEDVKDREERRDRERDRDKEREKEKEPAWMDADIPDGPSFGILGGKGADGELDGIQAWKKGMKEKEQKEKEKEQNVSSRQDAPSLDNALEKADAPEKQLDEIQLFKLMMKREEEKKKLDSSPTSAIPSSSDSANSPLSMLNGSYAAPVAVVCPGSSKEISQPQELRNTERDQSPSLPDPPGNSTQLDIASIEESVNPHKISCLTYTTDMTQPEQPQVMGKAGNEAVATYNPPSASRLLSLGRPQNPSSRSPAVGPLTNSAHPTTPHSLYNQLSIKPEGSRLPPGFSPFEDPSRSLPAEDHLNFNASDLRRFHAERSSANIDTSHLDSAVLDVSPGHPGPRGSRFAKFFDNKLRESSAPLPKLQAPAGLVSSSPHPGQGPEQNSYEQLHGSANEPRTLEDVFAMLNNSSQGHRNIVNHPSIPISHNLSIGQQTQNSLQLLQQAAYQQQAQVSHRLEPLYESRLEDRNFVPDGMVPGLRTIPPTRNRDAPSLYAEGFEDIVHHNLQRSSQQRLDSIYSAPQPMFNPQRNVGIPLQQPHFRGGPSPISGQQGPLQNTQRLPPSLLNLGGRPPHESSQFLNMPGVPNPNLHVTAGPPQQQNFNTFTPNGGPNFNNLPLRGPLPTHQLQNSIAHHAMGGLNQQNNLNPNHAQYLSMSGASLAALRGVSSGLGSQQGQGSQVHNPMLSMRQQQSLHPHALPPNMMPPHLSQQALAGQTNQPAHDLMALLMGGSQRE